jgi:colicin import membrane protein
VTTNDEDVELVPPGYRFDVVWRGYHRRQVNEFLDIEVQTIAMDRDAAVDMVADLAGQIEASRSEFDALRARLNRLCRQPLAPASVDERLGRMIELVQGEASAIVTRARATAEHLRTASLERIRQQEECADRRRQQIEDDFMIAMATRREESMRALREHEVIRRAEADRLVRDASEDARRRIASAAIQVDALRETHRRLAGRLRTARGLLGRACAQFGLDPQ